MVRLRPPVASRGYRRGVWKLAERLPSPPTLVRVGLAAFVLAWLFGPYALRSAVPEAELLLGGRAVDGEEHARSLGATGWAADGLGAAELLDLARR